MDYRDFKYKFLKWFRYLEEYVHNTFFKQLILFIVNFFAFGFLLADYLVSNFILAIGFLIVDLYLIKKLLYIRARPTKIFVIVIVFCLAFFSAQVFSETVFDKVGLTNFINLEYGGDNNSSLSDELILGGVSGIVYKVSTTTLDISQDISVEITASSKERSIEIFEYINELREQNGVRKIAWDDKIYDLALYKANDMTDRGYFDHPDPEGKCPGSYAGQFGLSSSSSCYADNLFGYSSPTYFNQKEAINSWMTSRGHRYNLLFSGHTKGAFACNSQNCVFIGYGSCNWVCDTGSAGLAYWENASKQPGEK
jgi:uncharacterized protein YkwD